MHITGRFLRIAAAGALVLGVAGVMAVRAPEARGQSTRSEPLNVIRTQIFGGSEIGVSLREVDEADVRREGLESLAGAVVEDVRRDGPAADAGFRAGDVVVAFDGERVRSARHLARLIEETPDGREVTASVVRAGERREMTVTPVAPQAWSLSENIQPLRELRDFNFVYPENFGIDPDDFRLSPEGLSIFGRLDRRRLGVSVLELTEQLADHYGVADGVLVATVEEDTPASRAGLEAGDVITRVAGEPVASANELRRRLAAADGEIAIDIMRDGTARTLRATFGDGGEEPRPIRRIRK